MHLRLAVRGVSSTGAGGAGSGVWQIGKVAQFEPLMAARALDLQESMLGSAQWEVLTKLQVLFIKHLNL